MKQTKYSCLVCGASALLADSLTDYHVAASVTGTAVKYQSVVYLTCETCDGSGEIEIQVGGDGFNGRCCAVADVPAPCPECDGSGLYPAHYDETSRLCKPCARSAFRFLIHNETTRAATAARGKQ